MVIWLFWYDLIPESMVIVVMDSNSTAIASGIRPPLLGHWDLSLQALVELVRISFHKQRGLLTEGGDSKRYMLVLWIILIWLLYGGSVVVLRRDAWCIAFDQGRVHKPFDYRYTCQNRTTSSYPSYKRFD